MKTIFFTIASLMTIFMASCDSPVRAVVVKTEIIGTGDISDTTRTGTQVDSVEVISFDLVDASDLTSSYQYGVAQYKPVIKNGRLMMKSMGQPFRDGYFRQGKTIYIWKDDQYYHTLEK